MPFLLIKFYFSSSFVSFHKVTMYENHCQVQEFWRIWSSGASSSGHYIGFVVLPNFLSRLSGCNHGTFWKHVTACTIFYFLEFRVLMELVPCFDCRLIKSATNIHVNINIFLICVLSIDVEFNFQKFFIILSLFYKCVKVTWTRPSSRKELKEKLSLSLYVWQILTIT